VNINLNFSFLTKEFECWDYRILTLLLEQKKITLENLTTLIENQIQRVLFDILQWESTNTLNYTLKSTSGEFLLSCGLKISLGLINVDKALSQTKFNWLTWCEKGLEKISPNFAPILKQQEQLQKELSPTIYLNLINLIDGKHSLRDLSVKMERDLLKLTCSLLPYIQKGFVELVKIPDIELKQPQNKQAAIAQKPLVICIDDSMQICQIMEQIFIQEGYQFIGIQDPLQAVSKTIAYHPDLIFLDIGMPIINGYEICAQLRRVSKLKNTPIIILTGQDGIADRVRGQIVGASMFITKPIVPEKILNAAKRLLSVASKDNFQSKELIAEI
jgi:two-component system, chemotaxis family, response regulator PixG